MILNFNKSTLAVAALMLAAGGAQADSGTASGNLNTSFAIGAGCHVSSNGGSSYADYGSGSIPTATNSIPAVPQNATPLNQQAGGGAPGSSYTGYAVQCGNTIDYSLSFGSGNYYGAIGPTRALYNNTAGTYIAYDLFDRSTNLPIPSDGTAALSGSGNSGVGILFVNSQITDTRPSQDLAPGGYGDVVTVSLSYGP